MTEEKRSLAIGCILTEFHQDMMHIHGLDLASHKKTLRLAKAINDIEYLFEDTIEPPDEQPRDKLW